MPSGRAVAVEPHVVVLDQRAFGHVRTDAADCGHVQPHHARATSPACAPDGIHIFSSW
jgi:hypothetical protein